MSCATASALVLDPLVLITSRDLGFTSQAGKDADFPLSSRQFQDRKTGKATGPKVLVVDDEVLIADTVADILNRQGYQAVAVYGCKEALHEANGFRPDIVLCDIIMPQVNGVDTALAVRRICPAARIILFSGHTASSALLDGARAQGLEFEVLAKPIHPRELLRKLAAK